MSLTRLRRGRDRLRIATSAEARERGTSLMELIVGMALSVLFGGMFTGAVVLMNQSANKSESVTVTATQLNTAFLKLDKMVRYAAAVSTPGTGPTSGDWYVELRSTYTGGEVCSQLRVDITTQQLQIRTWKVSNGTASSLSAWLQLGSSITNGGVGSTSPDVPFRLTAPTPNTSYQQLTIALVSTSGSTSVTTSRSAITFTALNSTSLTTPTGVCQEVARS